MGEVNESIHGYQLEAPFHNKNAGFSRWTFAKKDGEEYFIKEFLSPVYPTDPDLTSSIRKQKIDECNYYSDSRTRIYQGINRVSDGHLVRVQEFFRSDSHFYIVTERIKVP